MKAVIIGIVILITLSGGLFYFLTTNKPPEGFESGQVDNPTGQPSMDEADDSLSIDSDLAVDKKAAFAIFTNGTFRIFTDDMYHNQSEDIFIDNKNPNIVNIKKQNLTWDDFFRTLPFKLSHECLKTGTGQTFCTGETGTLKFYINGEDSSGDALPKVINNGDRLLVSFGNETPEQIHSQLKKIPNP